MERRDCGYNVDVDSVMDVDQRQEENEEDQEKVEEDPFLQFVDYARSELLSLEGDPNGDGDGTSGPGWSWIVLRILKTCKAYSCGVTPAILLSELSQTWCERRRNGAPKKRLELINQLKKEHRRMKLPNTVTIDSIYQKKFLSLNSVLEAVIIDAFVLPGTNIHMLTLGDYWSSNIIDLYLHRRFYDMADLQNGILKRGREIFLTGCYLRSASEGSGYPRLLPTEYLVILLDENQDDDAMLLAAQFCSDSFSSISLDAVNTGASYSFYARIESIESMEIQGSYGSLQGKRITLVDGDDVRFKFFLWGEQIVLGNLFSVGSMLALDKPYIAISAECDTEVSEEFCLEYGTATQLYLVPYIQHEEQVCVTLTPNRHQNSRPLSSCNPSQGLRLSQVSLPRDSQGTIDFSNYPFRSFVVDLRNKMTSVSLYGVVKDIIKEDTKQETVFSLKIADSSGAIWAKLHFSEFWSLGRVSLGHTVFISGLTCISSKQKRIGYDEDIVGSVEMLGWSEERSQVLRKEENGPSDRTFFNAPKCCLLHLVEHLEVSWVENGIGASFINLSCLPALINSYCLHKLSQLSDILNKTSYAQVCRVWLDPIEYYSVHTRFSHTLCGHFVNKMPSGFVECSFCHKICGAEVVRTFDLKITLADESKKVLAWCTGQTAMDLFQISPEEFDELPEVEQVMYRSSLEKEKFMVALVYCKRDGLDDSVSWEITRAYKCD